jgi:ERCC4-type nuclease
MACCASYGIWIDHREHALLKALEAFVPSASGGDGAITITTASLPIGDVWIGPTVASCLLEPTVKSADGVLAAWLQQEQQQQPPPFWILERKTLADLEQSIKDGRYREQKMRMLGHVPAERIAYLIEVGGNPPPVIYDATHPDHRPRVCGAIMNTLFRDGLRMVFTSHVRESAACVADLWRRTQAGTVNPTPHGASSTSSYVGTIKLQKKDNLNPEICMQMQLGLLPGLSTKKAAAIVDHFKARRLIDIGAALQQCGSQKAAIKCLVQVEGIGKRLAETLYQYLLPEA